MDAWGAVLEIPTPIKSEPWSIPDLAALLQQLELIPLWLGLPGSSCWGLRGSLGQLRSSAGVQPVTRDLACKPHCNGYEKLS